MIKYQVINIIVMKIINMKMEHENKIYELESEIQDRDNKIKDLERDKIELRNRCSKF